MTSASPGPCHGQRGLRPFVGGRTSLSKAPSSPPAPPQQREAAYGSGCHPQRCGCATVPLSPSWEATLHRLQLCCTALGTAEGERVSPALLSAVLEDTVESFPRARQLVFPMEKLRLHAGSAPGELSPRTRARRASPRHPCVRCSPVGTPSPRPAPEKWQQRKDAQSYDKRHVPVQIVNIVNAVRREKVLVSRRNSSMSNSDRQFGF